MADDTTLKIGGDAEDAVAAIREVSAEIRRMAEGTSSAFSEFASKFDASVTKKVPEGTRTATKEVGLFDAQWRKLTAAFSATALIEKSITAITDLTRESVAAAVTFTDLADRTGNSVEFFQRASHASKILGFDFERLSNGAFTLGVKLAGGSGSVRDAVGALGLSWEQLMALNPDQRMEAVSQALGRMLDPAERNRVAVTLFGGAAKTATDAAVAGWTDVGQAATVSSREQLEAVKRAKTAWDGFIASVGEHALLAFGNLTSEITETAASVDSLTESQRQEFAVQQRLGEGHMFLIKVQRERTKSQQDINLSTTTGVTAAEKYAAANAKAWEDVYALNAEQRKQILTAQSLGASTEDLTNEFGISEGALKLLGEETKKQAEADKAAADEASKHAEERKRFSDALFGRDQTEKARQYASALGSVTNISRLTTEKQEELNTAVVKALEVYTRLGETAPQSLKDIANATAAALAGFEKQKVVQFDDIFKIDTTKPTFVPLVEWNFERKTEVKFDDIFNVHMGGSPPPPAEMNAWAKGIAGAMQAAIQGGGNVMQSVGASIGGSIFKAGGAAEKAIESGATKLLGSSMGSAIGSVVPGLGTAIGAMAGQLMGKIAGALSKPEYKEIMKDVGRQWGVDISEGLAKKIEADSKELFGRDRVAGTIFNLDAVIKEAGGLTSANYDKFLGKLHDVFSMIQVGKFSVEQGRDVLDKNFGAFAAQIQSSKEIASASFLELFDLNERFGTESAAMRSFVEGQVATIGTGLATQLKGLNDTYKDLGPNIDKARAAVDTLASQGQAGSEAHSKAVTELNKLLAQQKDGAAAAGDDVARIGRLAVASFNAAIAKGADWKTALTGIGPALDGLTALQKTLGIASSDAAVQELQRYRALTQEHAGLFDAASSLNEVMVAMSSIGALNADTLADLEAQGLDTFNQLTAAGLTETQALSQMKDWVRNVDKAHRELGIPIDENTQKLLDQARAQGILEEEGTSTNDILKDGISALIEALGGDLPAAWKKSADSAAIEAARAKAATKDVETGVDGVSRKVDNIDWHGMASEAIDALGDVEDAVNAVSFGHSPGGLKEYPLLLDKASKALRGWRRDWSSELSTIEATVNDLGWPTLGSTTNYAATAALVSAGEAGGQGRAVDLHATLQNEMAVYMAVDPATGNVRQVSDPREIQRMLNQGMREGRITLPVRNTTARAA